MSGVVFLCAGRIINHTSQNYSENHTTCDELRANDNDSTICFDLRHDRAEKSFNNFESLLDKTVVGVFLLEQNRNKCLVSKITFVMFSVPGNISKI